MSRNAMREAQSSAFQKNLKINCRNLAEQLARELDQQPSSGIRNADKVGGTATMSLKKSPHDKNELARIWARAAS
jgi:hypothetical protein